MFEGLEKLIASKKRKNVERELDEAVKNGGYFLTDVLLAKDRDASQMAIELITGTSVDASGNRNYRPPRDEVFRFRTIDGSPMGRVRMGERSMTASERRVAKLHDEDTAYYKEFGKVLELKGREAVSLAKRYGYQLSQPGVLRKGAQARGDVDSWGRPVKVRPRWRIVEVGHRFEKQADRWYERIMALPSGHDEQPQKKGKR